MIDAPSGGVSEPEPEDVEAGDAETSEPNAASGTSASKNPDSGKKAESGSSKPSTFSVGEPTGDDSDLDDLDLDPDELAAINAALDNLTPGDFADAPAQTCEEALTEAVETLERVTAERDEYLETLQRIKADFDNYKKRTELQRVELVERAEEGLVGELLAVLDACDAAVEHGSDEVVPIHSSLLATLKKRGLEPVGALGEPFDPNVHEAVLSEPADDGDEDGPHISDVMRQGYLWNGRVVRAAMVKVKG